MAAFTSVAYKKFKAWIRLGFSTDQNMWLCQGKEPLSSSGQNQANGISCF